MMVCYGNRSTTIDNMEREQDVLDNQIWLQCLILQLVITLLIKTCKLREPQFLNVKDFISSNYLTFFSELKYIKQLAYRKQALSKSWLSTPLFRIKIAVTPQVLDLHHIFHISYKKPQSIFLFSSVLPPFSFLLFLLSSLSPSSLSFPPPSLLSLSSLPLLLFKQRRMVAKLL